MSSNAARWLAVPTLLMLLFFVGMASTQKIEKIFKTANNKAVKAKANNKNKAAHKEINLVLSRTQASLNLAKANLAKANLVKVNQAKVSQAKAPGGTVKLNGDGEASVESGNGAREVLSPSDGGDLVGLRVTEDGLESVKEGDLQDNDYLLQTTPDGGARIVRPDGTKVDLNNTENGLEATNIAIDGTRTKLEPKNGDVIIDREIDKLITANFFKLPRLMTTNFAAAGGVTIETENGPIDLGIDEDNFVAEGTPGSGESGELRLDEDGNIEQVAPDEIEPGDTVIETTDDGIELVRPDGTRIKVERNEDGEVVATEIAPDGTETPLEVDENGEITATDGETVGPFDFEEETPTEEIQRKSQTKPWAYIFGTIALVGITSALVGFFLHRKFEERPLDFVVMPGKPATEAQFEDLLDQLGRQQNPNQAIRLAFYAAESGFAGLEPKRKEETPFEWHTRLAETQPEIAGELGLVCDLFAKVRFAPEHADWTDRDRVVNALKRIRSTTSAQNAVNAIAASQTSPQPNADSGSPPSQPAPPQPPAPLQQTS